MAVDRQGMIQRTGDKQNLFHVIDSSGEDYFVAAENFGDAEKKFKAWERTQFDNLAPDELIEDPQAIMAAGYLITVPGEPGNEPEPEDDKVVLEPMPNLVRERG
jgi:hypothetical protein